MGNFIKELHTPETLLCLSSLTPLYQYLISNPSTILFLHLRNHFLSSSPFSPLRNNFLLSLRSKAIVLINLHVAGFPPILSTVVAKYYFKNVSLTPSVTSVEYCKMQVWPFQITSQCRKCCAVSLGLGSPHVAYLVVMSSISVPPLDRAQEPTLSFPGHVSLHNIIYLLSFHIFCLYEF